MSKSPNVLTGAVGERYLLAGELGRGGTAIVYRARDRARGIDVAIKIMRDEAVGSLSVQRFLLEIQRTSQLPHPHIVPVLDSGEHDGRPFFVLPYMDGGTLRNRIKSQKQLPFEEVISLGVTIAGALEFAHTHGVIHRDVKPENILFNNGQPCLADFGTSRALEKAANDPTTSTGVVRGTPAYMSPEQASGDPDYDHRTDIYSLACVLYEAIAGIQPFVGPTMQAVISQRLLHSPRPVSVYRPSVPVELEQVLERATSMAPADRYTSAREFADALEGVRPSLTRPRKLTPDVGPPGRRRTVAVVATVAVIAATVATLLIGRGAITLPWTLPAAGDTTRVAILPFEVTGQKQEIAGEDLMYEGLRRWTGLSTVEPYATNDAVRQRGGDVLTTAAAALPMTTLARLVAQLGAGRYVRGRVIDTRAQRIVQAALYDISSRKELYAAELPLPADPALMPATYAALADSLLLRGANDGAPRIARFATANLPGTQAFLRARDALADWNLTTADSLFGRAIEFDSSRASARLWLAQIRSWQDQPATGWLDHARSALRDSTMLTAGERQQALALVSLGSGAFQDACTVYRDITTKNPKDFAGWYGLGDCHRKDKIVIPDPASPSGWRFRSSYEQAIQAYKTAFELFPTSYRGVQGNAFQSLRALLFTNPLNLVLGQTDEPKPSRFSAKFGFQGDTVVLIPWLMTTSYVGASHVKFEDAARGAIRNRRLFSEVASRWSSSFPRSVGAKEAVGISLEMLGDPAAADSFRVARSLSVDRATNTRLAVEEAVVRMKFAVAERPADIAATRDFADSILDHARLQTPADAELALRLAMITGHCRSAARIARLSATPIPNMPMPPSVLSDAHAFVAMSAAGCASPDLNRIVDEIQRAVEPPSRQSFALDMVVGGVASMNYSRDTAVIRRLAAATNDYVLTAENDLLRGDLINARRPLEQRRPNRVGAMAGAITPDVALTEAHIWAMLGDTAAAVWLLDKSLTGLRYAQPLSADNPLANMLYVGAVGAAAELRALLSTNDPAARRRWALTAAELWETADPELQARAARMRALADRSR